ncbi:MAG: hypothetical protein QXR19_14390 [Candidatus Jordarchaeaceae archaeon]
MLYMVPMLSRDLKMSGIGSLVGFSVLSLYTAESKLNEMGHFGQLLRDAYIILYPLLLLYSGEEKFVILVDALSDVGVSFPRFSLDNAFYSTAFPLSEEWIAQVNVDGLIVKQQNFDFPKLIEEKYLEKILNGGVSPIENRSGLSRFIVFDLPSSKNARAILDDWFVLREEYRSYLHFFFQIMNQADRLMNDLDKMRVTSPKSPEYLSQKEKERDLRIQELIRRKDEIISAVMKSSLPNKDELIAIIEKDANDYIEIERNRFETIKRKWQSGDDMFQQSIICSTSQPIIDLRRKLERIKGIVRDNSKRIEEAIQRLMRYTLKLDEYPFNSDIVYIYVPYFLAKFQNNFEHQLVLVSPMEISLEDDGSVNFIEKQEYELFKESVKQQFSKILEQELEGKGLLSDPDFLKSLREALSGVEIAKPVINEVKKLLESRIEVGIPLKEPYRIELRRSVMDRINEYRIGGLSRIFNMDFQGDAKQICDALIPHLQNFDSIDLFRNDGPPFSTLATFSSGTKEENRIYIAIHIIGSTIGGKIHVEIAGSDQSLIEKICEKTENIIRSICSTVKMLVGNEYICCPYCGAHPEIAKITRDYLNSEGYVKCVVCGTKFRLP